MSSNRLEEAMKRVENITKEDNFSKEEKYIEEGLNLKRYLTEALNLMKKYDKENFDLKQSVDNKLLIKKKFETKLSVLKENINDLRYQIQLEQKKEEILENIIQKSFDIEDLNNELLQEEERYKKELEKYREKNNLLNITDEELEAEAEKRILEYREQVLRRESDYKKALDAKFDEEKIQIEALNESEIEILKMKFDSMLKKIKVEHSIRLENIKEECKRIEADEEKAKKNLQESVKYLGFDDFIHEKEFYFQDKILAYNILVRIKNKNKIPLFYLLKEMDFAIIYRHTISSINLLINQKNQIKKLERKILELEYRKGGEDVLL